MNGVLGRAYLGCVDKDQKSEHEEWTSRHFSLANALDDSPSDLPLLLRRVADRIEASAIRPDELLDVTISSELREFGPWWSATVYWSRND